MNVLLTSAGRRNYLVNYFQVAMKTLSLQGAVYAADVDPTAAALAEADRAFTLPSFETGEYVDQLLGLCKSESVDLVVPLNDVELPILAANADRFERIGIRVVVSSSAVIDTCFDKTRMDSFLRSAGLAAARTYLSVETAKKALADGELSFPLVVKPRWGSGSIGLEFVETTRELELAYELALTRVQRSILARSSGSDPDASIMVQERIEGIEYGLDVLNDLNGANVCVLARQKLRMRSGETDKAVTVCHEALHELGRILGARLGHIGNLDCDVIVNEKGYYVIDMNPRFGGGYPFSHAAGANIPAIMLSWLDGRQLDPSWLKVKPGVAGAKCDRVVAMRG